MSLLQELEYKSMSNITFNAKQNEAYKLMVKGESVFVTGPAGTGKSLIIKTFVDFYKNHKKIALTSTTGTSALIIGGTTMHSFLGIGLGTGSAESISNLIFQRAYLYERWTEMEILVIDEVSMLSPELFDKLDEIAKKVRRDISPFGGIQLILSGDFLQLPCINSKEFCFRAKKWSDCVPNVVRLDKIIRQDNIEYQQALNEIRIGKPSKKTEKLINSRVGVKLVNEFGIKPTKLYPLNYSVDKDNDKALDKLARKGAKFNEYVMDISLGSRVNNRGATIEKFKKYCNAPEVLQLCSGAQVMLLKNLDLDSGLANGSRGVVTGFTKDELPIVKFVNGCECIIDYHQYEMIENDIQQVRAIQLPLKVAYAISIHKCQGCTLDYVEINLSDIFEYGQGYVGLSRVKNLEGLSIISIDWGLIQAHSDAVKYYENID
jgi:ATP-dependent DNA helicase PIF1